MKLTKILVVGMMLAITGCTSAPAKQSLTKHQNCGGASWYALHGNRTASGERMNMHGMTAAHKSLKFGTKIKVTNPKTGKSVVVRINDRGPFIRGRILDLSKGSASKLGIVRSGHGRVCYNIVK